MEALLCWPVIDRGRRPRDGWRPGLLAAAGATILVAVTILFLVSRQALDGPALIGPNATGEAFALTQLPPSARCRWRGRFPATRDETASA